MQATALASRLRAPRDRASLLLAAPLLAALGVVLFWSADGGGYSTTAWYPGALVFLGLLAAGWIAGPGRVHSLDRRTAVALGLFAAFTAWSYASIGWATSRGDAWDGANRTLLYLTVFALFATASITGPIARGLVTLYAAGVAAIGLLTIQQALHAARPAGLFLYGRLSDPTGYSNATAALFLIPAWPLLAVAARRAGPALHRGLALGLVGLLVALALIPQSRGAAFSLPIIALAYLIVVPGRLRSGLLLALVGAVVWLARHPILAVYSHPPGDPAFASTLSSARTTLLAIFAALFVLGVALSVADHRLELPGRLLVPLRRGGAAGAAALLVALCAFALVRLGGPADAASSAWRSFKGGEPAGTTRFVSLGSHRYDFWRVSLDVFARHPLTGVGSGNFAIQYVRDRRSDEEPLYPHSLEMSLLEQTGVVGTALFAGAIGLAVAAALRRRRRNAEEPDARPLAAAMAVGFGYWLLHGSADWLWEFPALGAGAFALLGGAVSLGRRPSAARGRSVRADRVVVALVAALLLCAIPTYGLPWAAALEVNAAAANWSTHPDRAAAELRLARRLNPLSDTADVIGAVIASRRRDFARMRAYLDAAIARNPSNWYSHLDLAAADSMLGDRGAALNEALEAHRLNPREQLTTDAVRKIRAGGRVDPRRLDAVLLYRDRRMH
jgi:hypothetical protein